MFVILCDSICFNLFCIFILCLPTRVERLEMCRLLKYCAVSFPVVLCGHCYNCLCSQRVCLIIYSYIPIAIWVVDIGVFSVKLWRCLGLVLSFLMSIFLVVSFRILHTHLSVHLLHIFVHVAIPGMYQYLTCNHTCNVCTHSTLSARGLPRRQLSQSWCYIFASFKKNKCTVFDL